MPVESAVYLDYNATSPIRPQARDATMQALRTIGNPSSVHASGRMARRLVEEAREALGQLVGASASSVVFTSGGTEASALALNSLSVGPRLVSSIEHPCMMACAKGVEFIPVTSDGRIDLVWLGKRLTYPPKPVAVVVMLANNETGVIQPMTEIVRLAHSEGIVVVCDAVQALGKIPVNFDDLGVDVMVMSGHKVRSPAGGGGFGCA